MEYFHYLRITMKITRKMELTIAIVAVAAVAAVIYLRYLNLRAGVDPSWEDYPVRGIDISAHNGAIDFEAVARQGYRFVLIKASEGGSFKDARYPENMQRAREAGLKVGAYHFFRFDAPGRLQALNFLHSLRGQQLDLPVVVDVEQHTNPKNRSAEQIGQTLSMLIGGLELEGHDVMIYSNKDGYADFINRRFASYPLWICSFSNPPRRLPWVLWQYTHRGKVEGVEGSVDIDIFNGSVEQWEEWCATHTRVIQ